MSRWLRFRRPSFLVLSAMLAVCFSVGRMNAGVVQISVTNQGNSSFYLTPVWFGFHDGTYSTFTPGSAASLALEGLAEDGIVGGLQASFTGGAQGVLANASGFGGAPIIDPGETATMKINVDSATHRFLSFASMIIPSNDAFIGNPTAINVFDAAGNVNGGTFTFGVTAEQIWDAGTEVNDTFGAAFSQAGGVSSDENGVVSLLAVGGLDNFLGTLNGAGETITDPFTAGEVVATFSISAVPEPSSVLLMSLVSVGFVSRRFRKRSV